MKKIQSLLTPKKKTDGNKKAPKTIYLQPTVVVLATYILLLLSKIIDITLINRENEYYSVVILQMMIFLLPGAIWCMFSGEKYISRLRLTVPRLGSIPLMLAAAVMLICGSVLISVLFGGLESLSGNFTLYDTFVSKDNGTVPTKLYLVLAYAVLPAICEEFIFRGIVCLEYENGGVARSIVFSACFFGMLHFDITNLPVYVFSGAVLALTLYATRSLFGAIIVHFLYNLFGLFGQPYMNALYNLTGSTNFFIFFTAALFLISAIVFCGEASRLYRRYLYQNYSASYRRSVRDGKVSQKEAYLEVIKAPSAIACLCVYIIALIISWL